MTSMVDESTRQRAPDTDRVLDSLPRRAHGDIVQPASINGDVPVAPIALIDRDRQGFNARRGLELRETARDVAFCGHAIRDPERLMEVPEARADARIADHRRITGDTAMRFHAGMPLVPGGAAIGTVCVIDPQPRELSAARVLLASGASESPGEVTHRAFMHADQAMSRLKDGRVERAAA